MGDILKAIHDDTEAYYALCERFGEEHRGNPYGEHAKELEARADYLRRCEKYGERVRKHNDGSIASDGRHARTLYLRENPRTKKEPKFRPSNKLMQAVESAIANLIEERERYIEKINAQLATAERQREELQAKCKHKWVSLGGFIYCEERCTRCGKTETY